MNRGHGDCYRQAFHAAERVAALTFEPVHVVHALVVNPDDGTLHVHAWAECADMAYDQSIGELQAVPKALYYRLGGVGAVRRYSIPEVRHLTCLHQHWGPWDEPLVSWVDGTRSGRRGACTSPAADPETASPRGDTLDP